MFLKINIFSDASIWLRNCCFAQDPVHGPQLALPDHLFMSAPAPPPVLQENWKTARTSLFIFTSQKQERYIGFRDSETHAESTEINQNKRKWGRTTFPEKSSVQFRLWQNPPAAWASPALHITCLLVNRQPAGQNCQDGGSFPYDTHWNDLTRWSEYLKWSTRGCKLTLSQPRKCGAALFLEKGAWATLGHGHMEGGSSRAHTGHIGVVLTWTPSRSSTQVQAYETVIWRTLLGITEWTSAIKFSSLLEEKVLQKL